MVNVCATTPPSDSASTALHCLSSILEGADRKTACNWPMQSTIASDLPFGTQESAPIILRSLR
jgi:hypothetical protein